MTKKIEKSIFDAYKEYDDRMIIEPPNTPTLLLQLKESKKQFKKKQRIEFVSFLLFAVFFITIFILLVSKSPIIYFVLQVASFVIVIIYIYMGKKKHAKRSKVV